MNSDETIDIRVVFKSLVEKKNTILFFLAISSVISIYASLALPNLYKSEALVEAVNSNSDSSGLGGLGGLASMAGVSISGPGGGSEAESAIAMTKSRDFFNSLINDYDFILPALMATESFNPQTKKIEFDEKKYNQKKKEWNSYSSWVSSFKKPTNDEAYRYFIGKVFKVSRNNKTGYLLMTVEHKSPLFSHDLLKVIIKEVNQRSRQKDLKDSSKSLSKSYWLFLRLT